MLEVYKNLHKKKLSVRSNGKIIFYTDRILLQDVEFRVQPAGREKVRLTKRKNVHAYIRGTEISVNYNCMTEVYYNPYKVDTFVYKDTGQPIYTAKYCLITYEGVYVN